MKNIVTILGIILIILGIVGFSYKYFSYTTQEKVAQIGSVQVTNEEENVVAVSPALSGTILVAGLVLVAIGISRKS